MAITQIRIQTPANVVIFTDTVVGNAVDAIKASSAVLYYVIIDNTLNVAASYLKLYNLASGSTTVGTSAPDQIIYCPASSLITVPFYTGAAPGVVFGTALTAACVTAGGTAGTVSPSSAVVFTAAYV
jgi:hypothetical protein